MYLHHNLYYIYIFIYNKNNLELQIINIFLLYKFLFFFSFVPCIGYLILDASEIDVVTYKRYFNLMSEFANKIDKRYTRTCTWRKDDPIGISLHFCKQKPITIWDNRICL